jgi:hypothetical protein
MLGRQQSSRLDDEDQALFTLRGARAMFTTKRVRTVADRELAAFARVKTNLSRAFAYRCPDSRAHA